MPRPPYSASLGGCAEPVAVYLDWDNDGYGDQQGGSSITCAKRPDWSELAGDCDNFQAAVYPGAPEQCNERDDNCNGEVDEDIQLAEYYVDSDGDGDGDPPWNPSSAPAIAELPVPPAPPAPPALRSRR